MYSVNVRDHLMIAHSLQGEVFGPAQRLHGATYVVDATFSGPELDDDGILLDIGRAGRALYEVVQQLTYRNLDDESAFENGNSSTEVIARLIADRLVTLLRARPAVRTVTSLSVTLHESHIAWARYERAV